MFFMEIEEDLKKECLRCGDTGIVKEDDNSVHVCYDCLKSGKLDVHSKDLKDSELAI